MRRVIVVWAALAAWFLAVTGGVAEGAVYTGQVHPVLPSLTLTVTDTGRYTEGAEGDHILQVVIEAEDGSLVQTLCWESIESPAFERIAPLARITDLNFDGYGDLMLLHAQGARNVFYAFSLWDVAAQQFRPVQQGCEWLREEARYADEIGQIELCNPELYPEQRMLLSDEQDGYRYRRSIYYLFDSAYAPEPKFIWDVYDAGEGVIGEALTHFATGVTHYWDEQYPEEWYYGQEGVAEERRQSVQAMALSGLSDARRCRVANVDWVNLRRQDSKGSPSLARLAAGESVTVLADACGPEDGWVRVLYDTGENHGLTPEEYDSGRYMLTGYIWHSYLEPFP